LRDLALAWESLANTGIGAARPKAEEMLRRSARQFPTDAATLSALGYEEQMRGDIPQARTLYRQALRVDPDLIDVATNLGVIEAETGNFPQSIDLLQGAFQRAPGRSSIGMDLARVYCLSGNMDEARTTITRVLEFNPDLSPARRLLKQLSSSTAKCNGS
jgi:Flp pilus assembly protein TadD